MSNQNQKLISFVIPVYNEEGSVGELHREIVMAMKRMPQFQYEIIFVDDGSTDTTLEELKKLSPVKIISFSRNFGKSQGLQAGFDVAKGYYVFTLDGDLQDDPNEIPNFLNKMQKDNIDLVCGWKQRRADTAPKRIVSRFANFVTRVITGVKIHDMNCCFKLYRAPVMQSLRLYGDMHRFIPSIVTRFGFLVDEVPINHRSRRYGKSKYGIGRLAAGSFDFLTLIFLRKFTDRPMHFFGLLGAIMGIAGSVALFYLAWIRLFDG